MLISVDAEKIFNKIKYLLYLETVRGGEFLYLIRDI